MSNSANPLKPGKVYRMGEDGNLVEVQDKLPEAMAEIPDDDLPPDMRSAAATKKAEELVDSLKQVNENMKLMTEFPKPIPVAVTERDRQAFLRSVISGKAYTKEFTVFGGSIKVTFKTLTTSELDAVSEAIVIQSNRVPYASMMALAGAHMRFSMACSLTRIETASDEGIVIKGAGWENVLSLYPVASKKDVFYVKEKDGSMQRREAIVESTPGQKIIWAATDKFSDIQGPLYNVLFELYQKFDAEVVQMTKEAGDPGFFLNGADGR